MAATVAPALEGTEQFSGRRPGYGMATTFASSVPDHNLPGGGGGRKRFRREPGSSSALTEVFSRLVSVMYSKERKRFPEELFLPGFPTRDNLQAGTEDSQSPLTIPPPRPNGGVLVPQLNYFLPLVKFPILSYNGKLEYYPIFYGKTVHRHHRDSAGRVKAHRPDFSKPSGKETDFTLFSLPTVTDTKDK